MDIQSSLLTTTLNTRNAPINIKNWAVGQLLSATVTGRQSNNHVQLQINNQALEAKLNTSQPLDVGTQLKLQVEKQGHPVLLRVVQQNTPKPLTELKQQLLRENLPKQQGLERLTQLISQVSNQTKSVVMALPVAVERQMQKTIEQLPRPSQVKNADGLKSAVKDSGLFLEAKLLAEPVKKSHTNNPLQTTNPLQARPEASSLPPSLAKDLKANLLQLMNVISKHKPTSSPSEPRAVSDAVITQLLKPKLKQNIVQNTRVENTVKYLDITSKLDIETLHKQLESSVARIEVNQAKAIVSNENPLPNWSVEIPIKDKQDFDLLKLDIQADDNPDNDEQDKQLWTVNLRIDFDSIGTLVARVSLVDKEINATLWSDNQQLNILIRDNLSTLSAKIEQCGLTSGNIECLDGMPETTEQQTTTNLVNIKI